MSGTIKGLFEADAGTKQHAIRQEPRLPPVALSLLKELFEITLYLENFNILIQ